MDEEPPSPIQQSATCTDYRQLRDSEVEELREELRKFDDDHTKITVDEMKRKKDLVDWLLGMLLKDVKLKNLTGKRTFKAGSAYEKLQAGEAADFDVMLFLDISKGIWKVTESESDPQGFCSIKLLRLREPPKKKESKQTSATDGKEMTPKDGKEANSKKAKRKHSFIVQLLDKERRLSALKVRKLFTSKIDQVLKKKQPLSYTFKETVAASTDGVTSEKSVRVDVLRKQRGPATTLAISCAELNVPMFTLDIVNCLHANQLGSKNDKPGCDFVAKPVDKTKAFSDDLEHLWRRSYSRQEINTLRKIDSDNQIHRRVLKVFKILRKNQSQLKYLKSYIYKNVLLFLSKMPGKSWKETDLPNRFVDMIIALRNCLAVKRLPVFFNRKINLLADYEEQQLVKIMGFLRRIANRGIQGYKELLSLKEKDEMAKIAAAQAKRKRRKRRNRLKTSKEKKTKSKKESLDDLLTSLKAESKKDRAKGKEKKTKPVALQLPSRSTDYEDDEEDEFEVEYNSDGDLLGDEENFDYEDASSVCDMFDDDGVLLSPENDFGDPTSDDYDNYDDYNDEFAGDDSDDDPWS